MDSGTEFLKEAGIKMIPDSDSILKELELDGWMNESVLDPIHDKLCQEIWTREDKLKPEVKKFFLDSFEKWQKQLKKEFEIKSMTLMGSIATYQFSETSDIDIQVETNLSKKEISEIWYTIPKDIILPGSKHPMSYYITPDYAAVDKSDVAYDVFNDKWLKKPKKSNVEIPFPYIVEIAKFFMAGIEDRIAEYEHDKSELEMYKSYIEDKEMEFEKDKVQKIVELKESEIKADLDALFVARHVVKAFRKEAYEKAESELPVFFIKIEAQNPNLSINNLVYKLMDKFGYLEKLEKYKDIREKLMEKTK
jgi:hypothetical protein